MNAFSIYCQYIQIQYIFYIPGRVKSGAKFIYYSLVFSYFLFDCRLQMTAMMVPCEQLLLQCRILTSLISSLIAKPLISKSLYRSKAFPANYYMFGNKNVSNINDNLIWLLQEKHYTFLILRGFYEGKSFSKFILNCICTQMKF